MSRQIDWRFRLISSLEGIGVPRVLRIADIRELLHHVHPTSTALDLRDAVAGLLHSRTLHQFDADLFLNRRAWPPVELAEAAQHIRPGAIVSLESVLGEVGFLHNPTREVFCVVPDAGDQVHDTHDAEFRYQPLPGAFFPTNESDVRLLLQAGRQCPHFKPEAALLQWLHLTKTTGKNPVPQDVDFACIDLDLTRALAARWGLVDELEQCIARFI